MQENFINSCILVLNIRIIMCGVIEFVIQSSRQYTMILDDGNGYKEIIEIGNIHLNEKLTSWRCEAIEFDYAHTIMC